MGISISQRISLAAFVLLPACAANVVDAPQGGAAQGSSGSTGPAPASDNATGAAAPAPLASLRMANGNTIEFYKLGNEAFLSEIGAAYSPPSWKDSESLAGKTPVQVWTELAPSVPVPGALAAFQAELDQASSTQKPEARPSLIKNEVASDPPPSREAPLPPQAPGLGEDVRQVSSALQEGCNNGCCDFAWLDTFKECDSQLDYGWFLFNKSWSSFNGTNVGYFGGFVCSATGMSTWQMSMAGNGGVWPVPQATWRRWTRFSNGWFSGDGVNSQVNSPSNGHLHTYCGTIAYF